MTKSQRRAEERVVRAAMDVHKLWVKSSYYSGKIFAAVVRLDDACQALAKSRGGARKAKA